MSPVAGATGVLGGLEVAGGEVSQSELLPLRLQMPTPLPPTQPTLHPLSPASPPYPARSQALVLMEFLVANGSERTIDDLRDHMFQLQVTLGRL